MPPNISARVFLIRHGETPWTLGGKHMSSTDILLSKEGEAQVELTRQGFIGEGKLIEPENVNQIYVSPGQRTRRTTEILQLGVHHHQHFWDQETHEKSKAGGSGVEGSSSNEVIQVTPLLREWDYGKYEGLTVPEIREKKDNEEWNIWTHGCPGGETPQQVANRVDALIAEIKEKVLNTAASWPGGSIVAHATGEARDIVCIGHGHILSAMALRWTGQSLANGLRLLLEPSSVAVLGFEHDNLKEPAIFLGRKKTG